MIQNHCQINGYKRTQSGALINTDDHQYNTHKSLRELHITVAGLVTAVEELRSLIKDIKKDA